MSIRGSPLIQVLGGQSRSNVRLDLLFTNKETLSGHMVSNGNLSYSEHEIAAFRIPRGVTKDSSRAQILELMKTDFGLFRSTRSDHP